MKRRSPALPLLVPVLLAVLAGCGSEQAGAPGPADPAELATRARALGVAPEHVYVTEVPGYTLARQSVGVIGGDGFSAAYVSQDNGTTIQLSVDRDAFAAGACPRPAGDATSAPCVRDGDAWYLEGTGGHREYTLRKKGHVVRVGADGVPRDVLRTAAAHVHRPSADELDALLPSAPAADAPVERGDLPPAGDGAPDNNVGVSG
ncbi:MULTISPECIES: hypothetical protein [Streptomyces]|uniref:Membrane lipoprotein n=2 Tax=Streptomyces TaxID=1883 RepID=A0A2U9P983_STRAS|nr:hypothetical protein [Streptomyces actuosus]AWT46137.1 hypothetical protein DMT42_30140 [Streptomyces actuosus]MBM4822803.1 hypothetical protein [Streptomyces actuosus]